MANVSVFKAHLSTESATPSRGASFLAIWMMAQLAVTIATWQQRRMGLRLPQEKPVTARPITAI